MRSRQVLCPACGTILDVPPGKADCFVRCGKCHNRFRLPKRIAVTDDAVTEWLDEEKTLQEREHASQRELKPQEMAAISSGTAILPVVSDAIRLVKSDPSGALFEFPALRLGETAFRCAMPRKCLRCGGRTNLQAHIIIYATMMMDSPSLEAEHAAGALALRGPEVMDLGNEELLARLPRVPNVPPPADAPMPYWLCDLCVARDMISGQIRVNSEGEGLCRLWIGNLRRAEEFMVAAGGNGTAGHAELRHRIASLAENPWSSLPLAVQNRIQQWFRPQPSEHFIAYIPDRDRARSENGLAGIIISDKRIICHTMSRHKESPAGEKLEIHEVVNNGRQCLAIRCPSWEFKYLATDREGLAMLKHALTRGKIQAAWH